MSRWDRVRELIVFPPWLWLVMLVTSYFLAQWLRSQGF